MKNLYTEGFILEYEEDEISLERLPELLRPDIDDTVHIIIDGDTLQSIAFLYYNNPSLWYIIADINNIDNPFFLQTGDKLIIPTKNNV